MFHLHIVILMNKKLHQLLEAISCHRLIFGHAHEASIKVAVLTKSFIELFGDILQLISL